MGGRRPTWHGDIEAFVKAFCESTSGDAQEYVRALEEVPDADCTPVLEAVAASIRASAESAPAEWGEGPFSGLAFDPNDRPLFAHTVAVERVWLGREASQLSI